MRHKFLKISFGFIAVIFLAACQVATDNQSLPVPRAASAGDLTMDTAVSPQANSIAAAGSAQDPSAYDNLWNRISAGLELYSQHPHPSVEEELSWFDSRQQYIEMISERAEPFLFWIVEEIERRELPMELALLPMIESAYNPGAYSTEQAAGLWQFMGATGASYGLNQNWWYDGRRDPIASTLAALDYLEALNEQFDKNWLLTLAAYNAGDGTVRRAIRRNDTQGRSTDFWSLSLPGETESHVPKVLAVSKLVANPDDYNIELPKINNEAFFEVVEIDFQIDLDRAADAAALESDRLRELNPGYLQWATHPDHPKHILVPIANAEILKSAIDDIPVELRVSWDRYEIRAGDSLGRIAQSFDTRVDVLRKVNNLTGSRIIAGHSLLIPRGSAQSQAGLVGNFLSESALQSPNTYRVRAGDNLWSIAKRFNLRSSEIASANNIALNSTLHPGQILTLSSADYLAASDSSAVTSMQKVSYQIVRGDSLARIAGKYSVSVDDIVRWNNLTRGALIFPGQEIDLFVSGSSVN